MEGRSLLPSFAGKPIGRDALYWEHEGSRAIRIGKWKAVALLAGGEWELYDMEADRTEMHNLASVEPKRVRAMAKQWEEWGVWPHFYDDAGFPARSVSSGIGDGALAHGQSAGARRRVPDYAGESAEVEGRPLERGLVSRIDIVRGLSSCSGAGTDWPSIPLFSDHVAAFHSFNRRTRESAAVELRILPSSPVQRL